MKKLLLLLTFVCTLTCVQNAEAQTVTTSVDRPLVWGATPFQDSLWAIDTSISWNAVVYRLSPSLVGFTITGITGMATDPTTGITYVIMKLSSVAGRVLGTIDLPTGICTQVGNLGDNFSSLAFREDGQLFGVTGDGATVPETLYLIDKTNGTKTVAAALGAGVDGEVICYNRADDFFYHWSGNGTVVYEQVMSVAPYTATNIVTSGTSGGETFGAMYLNPTTFLRSTISSNFNRHSTAGVYSGTFGSNPDDLRGLVMLPYFTISDDTICQNESITLNGGGHQWFDNFIYHWGDGNSDTLAIVNGVLTTGSHTYNASGDYTVEVETDNGFGGDTVYSYMIRVNNIPVVALSGFTTVCSGDSVTLTATSGGTSQWYMNGILIPGATTNTYSTDQPGVYNMIKTNLNGCFDSASVGTTVILSSYPVVSLGPDTAACGWFVLDAGNVGSDYSWSSGDTTQMDTVMITGMNSVTVTNADGCATADTVNVTIHALPLVNVGPDTTVCGGILLDAGNPGSLYSWCDGSVGQTTFLVTSGTCMVAVTDTNGCTSFDTITVVVNPNPIVNLGPDVSACTMVTVTDPNLSGGSFMWCNGSTAPSIIITSSGTCELIYTDTNGCTGTDTINVTIYGNPTVTASASSASVCADDADVTLTGSPAGGTFSGTSVTGNNFDPSAGAGTYPIVYNYTDINGCSGADTITVTVSACVGIQENIAGGFSIYPNPAADVLNINLTQANSTVEVYDVLGNLVISNTFTNAGAAQIDFSAQPNGVYFVRVNAQDVQRVVIRK